jgi:membrane protein YdbS with pleckstrin-like domain
MSYIDNNLLPDEKIIFRTGKHPIIFHVPVVFLLIAVFFSLDTSIAVKMNVFVSNALHTVPFFGSIQRILVLFFLLLAAYAAIRPTILYMTADYAVTNKRIMMREGFFERHVADARLTAISNVNVDQGPLGQAFNFGDISLNSFGGTSDYFTKISKPNDFQKFVHAELNAAGQMPTGSK